MLASMPTIGRLPGLGFLEPWRLSGPIEPHRAAQSSHFQDSFGRSARAHAGEVVQTSGAGAGAARRRLEKVSSFRSFGPGRPAWAASLRASFGLQTPAGSTNPTLDSKTMEPNYGATDDEANTPLMEDSPLHRKA